MLIDMHVHTNRYSGCSRMEPEELAAQAIRCGLDGIVITEHAHIWGVDELTILREQFPDLMILRATEISAADRHDVLVYGVSDIGCFSQGMPVADVVEEAHRQGGAAVLAHPVRFHAQLSPEVLEAPFDAWETRSINIDPMDQDRCIALATQRGALQAHNSDAHDVVFLGGYANEFHTPIRDERDLVQAIKAGAFTPVVRQQWVEPAVAAWSGLREQRIQRLVARGLTDPEEIWQRMGGAKERIRRVRAGSGA